jgi:hypothetical protein
MADVLSHHDTADTAESLALSALAFQLFNELGSEIDADPALRTL